MRDRDFFGTCMLGIGVFLAAMILFSVKGCAHAKELRRFKPVLYLPIVVDLLDGLPHKKALKRAMNYWNCVLGAPAFHRIGISDLQIEPVPYIPQRRLGFKVVASVDWISDMSRRMAVTEELQDWDETSAEQVYRHELGHVLGLDHTPPGSGDVMQRLVYDGVSTYEVARKDVDLLRSTYGIPDPPYDPDEVCWADTRD